MQPSDLRQMRQGHVYRLRPARRRSPLDCACGQALHMPLTAVRATLTKVGFGMRTEIDVPATRKAEADVDIPRTRCAHRLTHHTNRSPNAT